MALTPPSTADLALHAHVADITEIVDDVDWATDALQAATDLFRAATGLTDDPSDEFELRLMRRGIMEMALMILYQAPDREAMYSPFTSERIGSYSYQKAQSAVDQRAETGVSPFDIAVAYFIGLQQDGGFGEAWVSSEKVFERKADRPELKTAADEPHLWLPDPSEP